MLPTANDGDGAGRGDCGDGAGSAAAALAATRKLAKGRSAREWRSTTPVLAEPPAGAKPVASLVSPSTRAHATMKARIAFKISEGDAPAANIFVEVGGEGRGKAGGWGEGNLKHARTRAACSASRELMVSVHLADGVEEPRVRCKPLSGIAHAKTFQGARRAHTYKDRGSTVAPLSWILPVANVS